MKNLHMQLAIELARKAGKLEEIPVGCVITDQENNVVSCAFNSVNRNNDPTAHAEIIAIRKACKKLKKTKLTNHSIYVTLEPCKMCETAIINAGIKKIYFGAYSDSIQVNKFKLKTYFSSKKDCEFLGGFDEESCSSLIIEFFKKKR